MEWVITMWAITTIVAVSLAIVGWQLINRLAKRREAYDLYCSVITLLEQLNIEGRTAWQKESKFLDEYTEWNLLSKVASAEQRIELINKHYTPTEITSKHIHELRKYLTTTPDLFLDGGLQKETRHAVIHRQTTDMIGTLLDEIYMHINKRFWDRFL